MTPEWIDRPMKCPSVEQLTPEEFRKLFGLSVEVYDTVRAANGIPAPVRLSAKLQYHPWEHAVFYSLWMRFAAGDFKEGVKAKTEKD